LDTACEGNTEVVVKAAEAEMVKIKRLRRELNETVASLEKEREEITHSLAQFQEEYRACEKELSDIAAPTVSIARASYCLGSEINWTRPT
jgi:septal ring factor EnvC (AmiA/AmiB activator)